jgi:hypothetical protein
MNLNQVTYGNPTQKTLALVNQKGLVDDLFESLKKETMPANDSELTKEELNEIVEAIALVQEPENDYFLKRYKSYDRSLVQGLVTIFKQQGIDVEQLCLNIQDDINPLIAKLKVHFNRPRPYQLANYYQLKLFPFESYTSDSACFPSGHTTQAYVMLNVIGSMHPIHFKYCKNIIEDISESRKHLGLHYQSDNDFSFQVGESILKHKEFAKKYAI